MNNEIELRIMKRNGRESMDRMESSGERGEQQYLNGILSTVIFSGFFCRQRRYTER